MPPHTSSHPAYSRFIIAGLIVAAGFFLTSTASANQATTTDDTSDESILERIFNTRDARQQGRQNGNQVSTTSDDADDTDDEDEDENATPTQATSTRPTTATSTATTTNPALQRQQDRDVQSPNPTLENVLNQILTPSTPRPQSKATTTKPQTTTRPTASTTATTTAAGTVDIQEPTLFSAQTANANSFVPDNYYIPLDKLSPQSTYALSTMAIILGIAGALLVLRERQSEPVAVWSQRMNESLLES